MSIHRRDGGYIVRWRDGTRQRSKRFDRKRDAQAFEAQQKTAIQSNSYTKPERARIHLSQLAEEWFATRQVSERTLHDYREIWRNTIEPTWGQVRLELIKPDAINSWISSLSKQYSPARVTKAFTVFKQILDLAVMGERLSTNPASRAKSLAGRGLMPKQQVLKTHRHLSAEDVIHLAAQNPRIELLILTMAFTGLRFGEVTALRVRDINILHSRIHVTRAVQDVAGHLSFGPPKSGQARQVPLPDMLKELLKERLASIGDPDALVFTAHKGGVIRQKAWRKAFNRAVEDSGLERLTPHDLRNTYAALCIHAGVGPKALQEAMGHSDIRLTMDLYAGLFDEDRSDHAARLDAVAKAAIESKCSPDVPQNEEENQKTPSRLGDLNPGPTHYECVALPLS